MNERPIGPQRQYGFQSGDPYWVECWTCGAPAAWRAGYCLEHQNEGDDE